jgi:hypothetical protein
MIPNLKKSGLLPTGFHHATWEEFEEKFAINQHRQVLLKELRKGLTILKSFGCNEIYIGGSFVTDKPKPGDIDVCFNSTFMNLSKIKKNNPEFFDSKKGSYLQKKKFGCEFFPFDNFDTYFIDFFSFSRLGEPKGLVKIYLDDNLNDKKRETI